MQQGYFAQRSLAAPRAVPLPLRFLGKLVLEVLPAALASVIGGFLFAHSQFGQPALHQPEAGQGGPASAEMVHLVHEEHDLIQQFLEAQQAAQKSRLTADNAADARAAAEARMAEAARRHAALLAAEAKRVPARAKTTVASAQSLPAPAVAPLVVARAEPVAQAPALVNAAPVLIAVPEHPSLVARTLAIPGHVVSVTLHAVAAIGGIPSWLGHRIGDDDADPGRRSFSAS